MKFVVSKSKHSVVFDILSFAKLASSIGLRLKKEGQTKAFKRVWLRKSIQPQLVGGGGLRECLDLLK